MIAKRWFYKALLSFVALTSLGVHAQSQQIKRLTATEAKDHIGEQATVCGTVASTGFAETTRGMPTWKTDSNTISFFRRNLVTIQVID